MNTQRLLAMAFPFLFATACVAAEDIPSGSCSGSSEAPAAQTAPTYSVPAYADETAADTDDEATRNISAWQKYMTAANNALVASNSPRDWALSTLFNQPFLFADSRIPAGDTSDTSRELLARAAAAAPSDAVIQWIRLWHERSVKDPDSEVRVALRRMEPDNAALWMDDLAAAAKAKDEAEVDFVLAQMAHGRNFDNRSALVNGAVVEAFRRFPQPADLKTGAESASADAVAETMAMLVSAMSGLPAYQFLVNACRFDAGTGIGASRRNDCSAIGRVMAQNGTDLISVQIGNVVLRVAQMYTDDDVKRSRETDWVSAQFRSLISASIENEREGLEQAKRWRETGNEVDAMRATVAAAGLPTSPPPDWQDTSAKFSEEALRGDKERFDELRAKSQ